MFASNREIDEVLQRYDPTLPENEELWITDISWRESATDIHLESLVSRGLQLFLVDHHRTAIERRAAGHLRCRSPTAFSMRPTRHRGCCSSTYRRPIDAVPGTATNSQPHVRW